MHRDPLGSEAHPDDLRSSPPEAVSDLVAGLTSERGWSDRLEGARIHEVWHEIAGPDLARHIRPVRLHGGVLVLEADSAAWATQVRYLSGELARRVNEVLGRDRVSQVRVVTGRGSART